MSIDPITLALAKAYTNSTRIGYEETKSVKVNSSGIDCPVESLIGCRLKAKTERWKLKTPTKKPEREVEVLSYAIGENRYSIRAGNDLIGDGTNIPFVICTLTSHSPLLWAGFAPTAFPRYSTNQLLMLVYMYDDVTLSADGVHVAMNKGWSVATEDETMYAPIDIDEYPIYFSAIGESDLSDFIIDDFFYELAYIEEYVDFTITDKHLFNFAGESTQHVTSFEFYPDGVAGRDISQSDFSLFPVNRLVSFEDGVLITPRGLEAELFYPVVHKIDKKFLPELSIPSQDETAILGANKAIKMLTESGQIGGVVQQKTIITPEQECTGTFEPGDSVLPGGTTFFDLPFPISPAPDKIWVNWDGTVYECDAVHDTYEDGITVSQYMAGTLENLVFCIMASTATPDSALVVLPGDSTTHTIGIYTMQETIRKADPKFLPESSGGGLPVVELNLESLNAAFGGNGIIDMPEKDMVILETARQNGMPCIFRIAVDKDGTSMARIANLDYGAEQDVEYNGYVLKDWDGATFLFRYFIKTGRWQCSIQQS